MGGIQQTLMLLLLQLLWLLLGSQPSCADFARTDTAILAFAPLSVLTDSRRPVDSDFTTTSATLGRLRRSTPTRRGLARPAVLPQRRAFGADATPESTRRGEKWRPARTTHARVLLASLALSAQI